MKTLNRVLAAAMLFAATANAQTTAKDSLIKALSAAKARVDSTNTLSTTPLSQYCRSYNSPGYVKNGSCIWQVPLLSRTQSALAEATVLAGKLGLGRVDTVKITTTVHDTVKVVRVDTVVVQPSPTPTPTPVAVASVSTSLASRTLAPGQTTKATASVKDSAGNTLTDRAIVWSSSATNVATVSSAGVVTAIAAGSSAIRATVDGKSSYATLTVAAPVDTTPTPTPTPIDTSSAFGRIRAILAPVAAGPTWYEDSLRAEGNAQWTQFGAKWDAGNSISAYERPAIYYKEWALTGDTIWRSRAHAIFVSWRDGYLYPAIANNSNTSPHWSQAESALLDCKVANDPKSCDAVSKIGQGLLGMTFGYLTQTSNPDVEARIQARVIVSQWMLEQLQGTPNPYLDSAIVQSLRVMNADGYTPFVSTCGGSLNYMNGMLYDVLTRIHDQRPGTYNAAIETKTKTFGDWLWRTQWRAADSSFNYVSVDCSSNHTGSPTAAPDLNGLMLPLFGWLGKTTKDTTWFTRGDLVVAGMKHASVYLYRQYSETFSSSFRYFGYRGPAAMSAKRIKVRKP